MFVFLSQRETDFLSVPPPHIGHLKVVDIDVGSQCLRVAADHQRGRKWPRLSRVILHATDPDSRLFHHLSADRFLHRFALVHKACQSRVHPHRTETPGGLSEKASIAIGYNGYDDRISTRKMFCFASRALTHQASPTHRGRLAASGAEAVRCVPSEVRTGLGDDTRFFTGDEHSRFARVADFQTELRSLRIRNIVRSLPRTAVKAPRNQRVAVGIDTKQRGVFRLNVNDPLCRFIAKPTQLGRTVVNDRNQRIEPGENENSGAGRSHEVIDFRFVAPERVASVDGVAGECVRRFSSVQDRYTVEDSW